MEDCFYHTQPQITHAPNPTSLNPNRSRHWKEFIFGDSMVVFSITFISIRMTGIITYCRPISTLTAKDTPPSLPTPLQIPQSKIFIISTIASNKITVDSSSHHQTFTMGDFWPGNILVRSSPTGGDLERIYVLDWELSKLGLVGLDVGQFTAEIYLLHRFNPSSSASILLTSFLNSYHLSTSPSEELAKIAATHVGAHLVAITPRIPPWNTNGRELTRSCWRELIISWIGIEGVVRGIDYWAFVVAFINVVYFANILSQLWDLTWGLDHRLDSISYYIHATFPSDITFLGTVWAPLKASTW